MVQEKHDELQEVRKDRAADVKRLGDLLEARDKELVEQSEAANVSDEKDAETTAALREEVRLLKEFQVEMKKVEAAFIQRCKDNRAELAVANDAVATLRRTIATHEAALTKAGTTHEEMIQSLAEWKGKHDKLEEALSKRAPILPPPVVPPPSVDLPKPSDLLDKLVANKILQWGNGRVPEPFSNIIEGTIFDPRLKADAVGVWSLWMCSPDTEIKRDDKVVIAKTEHERLKAAASAAKVAPEVFYIDGTKADCECAEFKAEELKLIKERQQREAEIARLAAEKEDLEIKEKQRKLEEKKDDDKKRIDKIAEDLRKVPRCFFCCCRFLLAVC